VNTDESIDKLLNRSYKQQHQCSPFVDLPVLIIEQ